MASQDESKTTFADDEDISKLTTYLTDMFPFQCVKDAILDAIRFAEKCYIADESKKLIDDAKGQLAFSLTVAMTVVDVFKWKCYHSIISAIFHDVLCHCKNEEKEIRSKELFSLFGRHGQSVALKMLEWAPYKKQDGTVHMGFPKIRRTSKAMLFVLMAKEYVKLDSMCEYGQFMETQETIQSHAVYVCMLAQEIYPLLPPVYKQSWGPGFHLIHPAFESLFQKTCLAETEPGEFSEFTVLPTEVSCMQVFNENKRNVEVME